jgi:hypothetical protein
MANRELIMKVQLPRIIVSARGFQPVSLFWFIFGVTLLFLPISSHAKAGKKDLYGTWRLISFTGTILATNETLNFFGEAPKGFLNYGQDGRMLVLIVSDKRPKPTDLAKMTDQERIELFKTLISYGGTYAYDGKTVIHHVDISFNENWSGTDQVREVKLVGNKLILSTQPMPNPIDGKLARADLTWERVQ